MSGLRDLLTTNSLRDSGAGRFVHAVRGDSSSGCDFGGSVFDEDCPVCEIGLLGYAARGADRCEHAARSDFSIAGGRRFVVPGRAAFVPDFELSEANPSLASAACARALVDWRTRP
jgi:hypothetical protein